MPADDDPEEEEADEIFDERKETSQENVVNISSFFEFRVSSRLLVT